MTRRVREEAPGYGPASWPIWHDAGGDPERAAANEAEDAARPEPRQPAVRCLCPRCDAPSWGWASLCRECEAELAENTEETNERERI